MNLNGYTTNLPRLLKEIYKSPEGLYFRGNISLLNKTCLSFVGTRRCTDYGEYMSDFLISGLSALDIVIVSGLAKGIDTIAHKSALANNLKTIAVLGSGLENIYPKENIKLANDIVEKGGLIISEYADAQPPLTHHFPQRNRIISALSIVTVVIEAPIKSGASITANFAVEQGREVFVVPGDVDRDASKGCLKLLQNGVAYPVGSAEDIIDLLKQQPHLFKLNDDIDFNKKESYVKDSTLQYNFNDEEKMVLNAIPYRRSSDIYDIKQKCDLDLDTILSVISILEINAAIIQKNGKYKKII